jgi:hypothetical protein
MTLMCKDHELYNFNPETVDRIYTLLDKAKANPAMYEVYFESNMFMKKSTGERRMREGYLILMESEYSVGSLGGGYKFARKAHMFTMIKWGHYVAHWEQKEWLEYYTPLFDCYNKVLTVVEDIAEASIETLSDDAFHYFSKSDLPDLFADTRKRLSKMIAYQRAKKRIMPPLILGDEYDK